MVKDGTALPGMHNQGDNNWHGVSIGWGVIPTLPGVCPIGSKPLGEGKILWDRFGVVQGLTRVSVLRHLSLHFRDGHGTHKLIVEGSCHWEIIYFQQQKSKFVGDNLLNCLHCLSMMWKSRRAPKMTPRRQKKLRKIKSTRFLLVG